MIVPMYKPIGWTSFDVVNKIRHITRIKRVGHAGTLDPMAEGVLIVAISRESTRQLGQLMLGQKVYEAEITLGAKSTTDDAEGDISATGRPQLPITDIQVHLNNFVGTIQQIPPAYSAIKLGGKPAYKLARAGKDIFMEPRTVTIDNIQLIDYQWPNLKITITCQKGVYIRSIARDLGGYLSKLIRTRVGEYTHNKCVKIEDFEDFWKQHESNQNPLQLL